MTSGRLRRADGTTTLLVPLAVISPAAAADGGLTAAADQSRWLRVSVILALMGTVCNLIFLWTGFQAWTVGLGVFLGIPFILLAVVLYLPAVIQDLRKRGAL